MVPLLELLELPRSLMIGLAIPGKNGFMLWQNPTSRLTLRILVFMYVLSKVMRESLL